jgi:hypothetical protein
MLKSLKRKEEAAPSFEVEMKGLMKEGYLFGMNERFEHEIPSVY